MRQALFSQILDRFVCFSGGSLFSIVLFLHLCRFKSTRSGQVVTVYINHHLFANPNQKKQ